MLIIHPCFCAFVCFFHYICNSILSSVFFDIVLTLYFQFRRYSFWKSPPFWWNIFPRSSNPDWMLAFSIISLLFSFRIAYWNAVQIKTKYFQGLFEHSPTTSSKHVVHNSLLLFCLGFLFSWLLRLLLATLELPLGSSSILFGFFLPIHLLLLFCLGILLGCFQEGSSRCCDSASKLLLFRVYTHTHTHTHTHTNGFFLFLGFPQGRQWGENLGFYCGILGLPEPPGFFFGHPTPPPPPLVHGARIKRELDIHFCGFAGAFVSYQHANNATRWSLESPWFHLHPSGQIVTCLFFLFVFGCILHA